MTHENDLYSREQHLPSRAVISRNRDCATWLGWLVSCIVLICFAATTSAANLIGCPDCGEEVSRRAVFCPHCGCPGAAISQAVQALEDAKKQKPVVRIHSDAGDSHGVGVKQGDARYVVLDVTALGTAQTLSIESTKGESLSYSRLEVAKDSSLVRFVVDSELLEYLPISQDTEHASTLNTDGSSVAAGVRGMVPVAKVGRDGGVMALWRDKPTETWISLRPGTQWVEVSPAEFRTQAALIARLREKRGKGALNSEDRAAVSNTKWISEYFRTEAQRLIDQNTQEQK